MDDARALTASQLDALREVANIGAAHAATALSLMTGHTIMISVPRLVVSPARRAFSDAALGDAPGAAVLLRMTGDLAGDALLVLPQGSAARLAAMMAGGNADERSDLGAFEESAIMEAGNILGSAYLNALSEFMGMVLLPSPPCLKVGRIGALLAATQSGAGGASATVFVLESEFLLREHSDPLLGYFLLLPDAPSLARILRAVRQA